MTAMSTQYTEQERLRLTQRTIDALEDWRIAPELQIELMGLPENTRPRALKRYRDGMQALPDDPDVLERARHIIGINESLVRIHPMNHRAGFLWLNNRSKYFPEEPPIVVMCREGLTGLHRVWANLDCTIDWD